MDAILSQPTTTATCLDGPPLCPIDVAALSVGRPDGVYYAGKRLATWMTFEERLRLGHLEDRDYRNRPADVDKYQALKRRREGESVVVRWEITDGRPNVPAELWDARDADFYRECRRYAYIWGRRGHRDLFRLTDRLLRDAAGDRDTLTADYDAMNERVRNFGDEWVCSAVELRLIMVEHRFQKFEREIVVACAGAPAGVDVAGRVKAMAEAIVRGHAAGAR